MPERSRRRDSSRPRQNFERKLERLADLATGIAKTAPNGWGVRKRFFASYHEASRALRRGDLDGAARQLDAAERTARRLVRWNEIREELREIAESHEEEVGRVPLELHRFPAICSLEDLRRRSERLLREGRPNEAAGVIEILRGSRARWREPWDEERRARLRQLPSHLGALPQGIAGLVETFPGLARRLGDELSLKLAGQRDPTRSRDERTENESRERRWAVDRRRVEAALSRWIERKERDE